MEMENRLLKLSDQVAFERSKGNIKSWSDEIKNEACPPNKCILQTQ